jgi:two-component system sensor histidine kinase VicK
MQLPEFWPATSDSAADNAKNDAKVDKTKIEMITRNAVQLNIPLDIAGKGFASLEIAARLQEPAEAGLEPQTAQLAIGCLALAAMLLIHRHARFRLKAIGAVHEALMAVKEGETDIAALELDPRLGSEAVAWNNLLGERQGQQIRTAIERVKQSIDVKCEVYRELAAAFDALPQGLLLIDNKMRAGYANGAAAILLQTGKCELTNGDVSQFIADQKVISAIHRANEDPACERAAIEVETRGSGVLRFTVRPIRREELAFTMVLIEDVTQQRVAEAARSSFIAKAAHELRSPLSNIRLYVETAIEQCQHDPASTARYLDVVDNESRRLERVVSEILSVSEIEAGSLKLRRDDVHLDTLLEQLKADYEAKAKEKQIALQFNLPPKLPVIHADRDKISLALQNLLGNAIKYTQQNGKVVVDATAEKGQIHIEVADTGIGISKQDMEKVFEKFYRAKDERVANIVGSGLGLSIAREVARLHGGDITAESELNKGSTFTLTLPFEEEAT